jgi:Fe-S-cluster containining protein
MSLATTIANNESPSLCALCGGDCCRLQPGVEAPERFLATPDPAGALQQSLASGLWVLDRHYGLPPGADGTPQIPAADLEILYPRPATVAESARGGIMATAGVGECIFLAPDGCRLAFSERPLMCRALVPGTDFSCSTGWSRLDAARAWLPWQELLLSVIRTIPPDRL